MDPDQLVYNSPENSASLSIEKKKRNTRSYKTEYETLEKKFNELSIVTIVSILINIVLGVLILFRS